MNKDKQQTSREELIVKKIEIQGKLSDLPDILKNSEQRRNLKRLLNRYDVLIAKTNPRKDNIERERQIDIAVLKILSREIGKERFSDLFHQVRNSSKEDFENIKIFNDEERESMYNDKTEVEGKSTAKLKEVESIIEQFSNDMDINEMRYLLKKIKAKVSNETILTADLISYR